MAPTAPPADSTVTAVLREWYGVEPARLDRLTGGLDTTAWCYRVTVDLVVRVALGRVRAPTFQLPRALADGGVAAAVAPIASRAGALSVESGGLTWAVYPYVDGADGYAHGMTDAMWHELGAVLREMHDARLPTGVLDLLPRDLADAAAYDRLVPVDVEVLAAGGPFAASWRQHRGRMLAVLEQMHTLSGPLRAEPRPVVPCHGDLHPGNVLISPAGPRIVDWDCALLAPRERDLIFATPALLHGYGAIEVDWVALTYYRCERVLQDVLEEARRAVDDPVEASRWLHHFLQPGGEADTAHAAAAHLPADLAILTP